MAPPNRKRLRKQQSPTPSTTIGRDQNNSGRDNKNHTRHGTDVGEIGRDWNQAASSATRMDIDETHNRSKRRTVELDPDSDEEVEQSLTLVEKYRLAMSRPKRLPN